MENQSNSNKVQLSISVKKQIKLAAIPVIGYLITFVVGCINMYRLKRWLLAVWLVVSLICSAVISFPCDRLFFFLIAQSDNKTLPALITLLVIIVLAYIVSYFWIWLQQYIANRTVKPNKTEHDDNEVE